MVVCISLAALVFSSGHNTSPGCVGAGQMYSGTLCLSARMLRDNTWNSARWLQNQLMFVPLLHVPARQNQDRCFTSWCCTLIPAWEVLGVRVNAEQAFFTPSSLVSSLCLNISYNSIRMEPSLHRTVPGKAGVIPQQIAECAYTLYDNQDGVTLMGL